MTLRNSAGQSKFSLLRRDYSNWLVYYMSYNNTVRTTYGYQNWIAHACSVIIVRRLTGSVAFFLFTRDYTRWLVSKLQLITIPTRQQSVVSEGRWGVRVA